jgi:hypothetical protein
MIPEFIDNGGPWKVLPLGIHDSSLDEVKKRFAINKKRKLLYCGFSNACKSLKTAGCKVVYLDGSYVTEKINPGDYDVCWDPSQVNINNLDPIFLDFSNNRKNQKTKYGGEFFPSSFKADGVNTFAQFFQIDKETGLGKGIIRLQLQ